MSTSLLHIADLHLDRAFAGMGCQGELAIRRRLGLREALRRAGRTAAGPRVRGGHHRRATSTSTTAPGRTRRHSSPTPSHRGPRWRSWWRPATMTRCWPARSTAARSGRPTSTSSTTSELRPHSLADGLTVWGLAHLEPAWQGDPLGVRRRRVRGQPRPLPRRRAGLAARRQVDPRSLPRRPTSASAASPRRCAATTTGAASTRRPVSSTRAAPSRSPSTRANRAGRCS